MRSLHSLSTDPPRVRVGLDLSRPFDPPIHSYQNEWIRRYARLVDVPTAREMMGLVDDGPTFTADEYRFRGRETQRAEAILRLLYQAANDIRRGGDRWTDALAIRITREDWSLLRHSLDRYSFEQHFGPEGTEPRFHGIRLWIDYPPRLY